jgi:hypothetical protein
MNVNSSGSASATLRQVAVPGPSNSSVEKKLSPHFHPLFLDGVYAPDRDGKGQMFHPAS